MTTQLTQQDLDDLKRARRLLENPSLAATISSRIGSPIEKGMEYLPANWRQRVTEVTQKALARALDAAVRSLEMEKRPARDPDNWFHKAAVATTGAMGGAMGLAALSVELPISTVIMLRSIADIARHQGEDIRQVETKLACLEVFALGGTSPGDDAAETGYFAVRAVLARTLSEAAGQIATRGLGGAGGSVIGRFLSAIASRFSGVVGQKLAAQAVPLIGAAGGAIVNTVFLDHFQDVARGHFTVRRLERQYGKDAVREAYEAVRA